VADGFAPDLVDAAGRAGDVVRIAPDLVIHPDLVEQAASYVAAHPEGVTVSALREALGTSRKFAVPLLEWMDAQGRTRRVGDLRFAR
jgi:selenocysteine-specific elongation factor